MSEWIGIPDNYEHYQGFVYVITNLKNNKKYIGQKSFWRIEKKPPLKNVLTKKVTDKIERLKHQYVNGLIKTKSELNKKIIHLKQQERLRRSELLGKKRRVRVETNWRNYYGSSELLLSDIDDLGEKYFRREIIWLCTGKWWLTFLELKEQIDANAIFRDDFYNGIINIRLANVVTQSDFDKQKKVSDIRYGD